MRTDDALPNVGGELALEAGWIGHARFRPQQSGASPSLGCWSSNATSPCVLEAEGFRVVEARSAREALRLPARDAKSIGLIVADVAELGVAGPRGVRERLAPGARVLRLSVSGSDRRAGGADEGNAFVLAGPFLADSLAKRVRALLEARSPAHPSGKQPIKK